MTDRAGLALWFPDRFPVTDPVLIFAIVMTIILIAPLLFTRWRIPGLLGLIVAGALVGPSVLGILERDRTMILLGTVGLLYLMFVAGLELDMNQFVKYRARSVVFGLLSFFIPQVLAVAASIGLLGFSWKSALLVGSIVGSHTPVAYPIARRLGITRNLALIMAIGGTIVCDMLALVAMAMVLGFHEGDMTISHWIKFAALIALYVGAVLLGLPKLGRWFFRNIQEEPTTGFVFLAAVLFLTAYAAHFARLEPIIGAFLVGLAMNRSVPEQSVMMSRVQFAGDALFIPFFLISVGMLVDVNVFFTSMEVWSVALLLMAIVFAGKFVSARIACALYGNSSDESGVVAGLSIPHASATLAVTLVGFDLGFFDAPFVNAVVLVIFLSCFGGAWMVEHFGRRIADRTAEAPAVVTEAPQRILIPLANPRNADVLLDLAFLARDPQWLEPVYPMMVVREGDDVDAKVAESERLLGGAVLHAAAANIPVQAVTRVAESPAGGILRALKELRISSVVIGWSGHTEAHERIFGSTLDVLLDRSPQEVMVCRIRRPVNTMRRLLVALPPSVHREPGFHGALRVLRRLAAQTGGLLDILCEAETETVVSRLAGTSWTGVATRFIRLAEWSEIMERLRAVVHDEDLLILMSAREGKLAWDPGLERLPRILARRFSNANLIVYYPSAMAREAAGAPHEELSAGREAKKAGLGSSGGCFIEP